MVGLGLDLPLLHKAKNNTPSLESVVDKDFGVSTTHANIKLTIIAGGLTPGYQLHFLMPIGFRHRVIYGCDRSQDVVKWSRSTLLGVGQSVPRPII